MLERESREKADGKPQHEFTTVLAVDKQHLQELLIAWPTWKAFRPEIVSSPMVVFCDGLQQSRGEWERELSPIIGDRIGLSAATKLVDWNWFPTLPQRERMLTAFAYAADHVRTPWFLKLDTDCIAIGPGAWWRDWWFEDDPAFVASPWGYSKPADVLMRLDGWANEIAGEFATKEKYGVTNLFTGTSALGIPFHPAADRIRHRRIISYVYWGNTAWHREIASLAWARFETGIRGRLPVPSQDTFHWYVAERTKRHYRREQQKNVGWRHIGGGNLERMRAAVELAMRHYEITGTAIV